MATKVLVAAQTAAASAKFVVPPGYVVSLVGWGFSGTDKVPVEASYDGGTNYVPCYGDDGNAVVIGAGGSAGVRNPVNVMGPGYFRVNKGVTSGTVGVAITETVIS